MVASDAAFEEHGAAFDIPGLRRSEEPPDVLGWNAASLIYAGLIYFARRVSREVG